MIDYITATHNAFELHDEYSTQTPVPHVRLKNFLPENLARRMFEESNTIPDHHWSTFERNGSRMQECIKTEHMPVAREFIEGLHGALGMEWLCKLVGRDDLISDPYLVGAGYSKSWNGDSLKVHTDFNWNDRLKLHRALSLIVYLTPDWDPEWKGALEFWDHKKENMIKDFPCEFNSVVIWDYHKRGFHGYPKPLKCPEDVHRTTFRLFFYYSDADYKDGDRPHRSLYWYDKETDEPFDLPTRK